LAKPLLSIIIPAHNEESRLPRTLEQVFAFVGRQGYAAEVIVVENGSTDRTLEIARGYASRHPSLRVMQTEGRGKGLAVRLGMLAAAGEFRFMCDADLSMPIEEVNRFLPPALEDLDVAIGSREVKGARRYDEPLHRHLGGRFINLLIRLLILPSLQDTQCGFKCFRAAVAQDLFNHQTLDGWSFDIELLYIAYERGYKVIEVPVDWYYRSESKVSAVRDALRMINDIFRIRLNGRRGLYDASRSQSGA
jgi:glycosyltransferase involved in cell wall biosynthesis